MKLRYFCLIILIPVLFSCSVKPPEDLNAQNFLDLIYASTNKIQELKESEEDLKIYMDQSEKEETLAAFYSDESIILRDVKREFSSKALLYSDGMGKIVVNYNIYVTKNWLGKYLYSIDNETWYFQDNGSDNEIKNIDYKYDLDSSLSDDKKTLIIMFSWEVFIGENAISVKLGSRELVNLHEGLILDHSDKKKININFKKQTLFIPRVTIVESEFNVRGNLIQSNINGHDIIIKPEKDLFLYSGDNKMGLSFDNENWDISIFAFKINSFRFFYFFCPIYHQNCYKNQDHK